MATPEVILELTGAVYQAAENPELWQLFVQKFARATRSTVAALVWHDLSQPHASVSANVGIDPSLQRLYEEYYAGVNVLISRGRHIWRPGAVANNQMIMTDSELARSEYANEYLRRLGVFHSHAGMIGEESVVSYISGLRPESEGPFQEEELSVLRLLMPHLQTAFRLHRQIAELEEIRNAAAGALDCLPFGCILLEADGKVLFLNRAAQDIVNRNDGLSISRKRLAASAASESRRLWELVARAAATGMGKGIEPGGCMHLSRPSFRRSLSVFVTPLATDRFACGNRRPAVAVFVADPDAQPSGVEDTVRRLFGLTAAESRLAALLVQGKNLQEAADELGVSFNTVRTHLSRIFAKTFTNRQSELVRILVTGPASLRRA